jgi:hypothetical protein
VPTDVSGKRILGYPALATSRRPSQVINDLIQPPVFVNQRGIAAVARSRPLLFNGNHLVHGNLCQRVPIGDLAAESPQQAVRPNIHLVSLVLATSAASAQVLTPAEIKDPDLRSLQQQYMSDLKLVGEDILALPPLEYRFYLSRKLDIDESQQQHADQRSIRFDRYNGQTVLAVTGNYYAAYPEKIGADQRARNTFLNVVMPILKSEVRLPGKPSGTRLCRGDFPSHPREGYGSNGRKAGKPDGVFAAKRSSPASGLQG